MIYTCTLNPAIDLFVALEDLKPNIVNRTNDEDYQANGKGINISFVLNMLGIQSTALGFIAGFTGHYIQDELRKKGVQTDFIEVDGITRVNVFVHGPEEFKIVNRGPVIRPAKTTAMLDKIRSIPEGSLLFVSGSLPLGMSDSVYVDIAKISYERGIKLILDISSQKVLDCLPYHPYLIKPNDEELSSWFGQSSLSKEELIRRGKQMLEKGARQILISRGDQGSVFINKDKVIEVSSVQGEVVNTACTGDTLLASFIAKLLSGEKEEAALRFASAAGASTAFSKGLTNFHDEPFLMNDIQLFVHHSKERV
ncbi:1-phosphofructokinase [Paenibacillus larvae]